jgi:CxxC motif-containing protein (DUF1111 family)
MRPSALVVLAAAVAAAPLAAQIAQPKMGAPLSGLTAAQHQRFVDGRVDFSRVFAAVDGLGPIFNQTSCASCHNNPVGGPGSITVTRFGFTDGKGTFDPLTAIGGSLLQAQAIDLAVQEIVPAAANTTATRVTTSTLGLGLIEAIPDAAIAARETTPPSANVSGRVHWVPLLEAPAGPLRAGRFGWKAQLATVLSFAGDAAQNELGFTNRLLPTENAPNGNTALLVQWDNVPDPEDQPDASGRHFIDRATDFQRYLAAPPQTPRSGMTGEALFHSVGCADCHTASFTTANDPSLEASLRNQVIRPYSDFLLHDMGGAADFIEQGGAGTQELRTPPLWGVRNRDPLWHDGRVVGGTLQTRILGPGGVVALHGAIGSEAAPSAAAFQALSGADQLRVVAFLDSLGRAEFDANGDNVRDQADLASFRAAASGAGGPWSPDSPQAIHDFNQDGYVTGVDLTAFALAYEVDCNNNTVSDLLDVLAGTSADGTGNLIPDECEFCQSNLGFAGAGALTMSMCGDDLTAAGSLATFQVTGAPPNAPMLVAIGVAANPWLITPTEYLVPVEPLAALVTLFASDPTGKLRLTLPGGGGATATWVFQAAVFTGTEFDLSNALSVTVGAW